ncbi:MAG: 2-polyprenyl-6-methoxyphenol hydroxylase-like FAD-dependent oxidoreductase [Candidatus Azotimanducaceae bacterium]|jgi:2-polyprenyl-6-methoxyphenol hydroxylase-like FAD-dependent oxidoreductase
MQKPIIIVGAGPVGLTLALLLHRNNIPVEIYEAVEEVKPLGVGINLLPHSVRVLVELGLKDQLDSIGVRTSALHYYNKWGQQIWAEPRGIEAGYEHPQYSIHRGKFQMMLVAETRQRLGEETMKTGLKLIDWEDTTDGVSVRLQNLANEEVFVEGRCLIAADGINSTARALLYPDEGAPLYGNRILWRGTSVTKPFLDGRTMFMAGHPTCKFVAYCIQENCDGMNNSLINWIAELEHPEDPVEMQNWNRKVNVDVFADSFDAWDFSWINIPKIIKQCQAVYEYPLSDRDPLPKWTFGNMTLIGDAAHPMYPIGSNGASQGILDAEKLSDELSSQEMVTKAFDNYELERRPATSNIVLSNRKNGPEQVMQLAEERSPDGFEHVHDIISQAELEEIANRYKQTAGFTVASVNKH